MSLLVQLLTLVNPVRVLILAILTYLLCPWLLKLINEFRFSKKFNKLPRLPIIGPAGWLLGNLDIYYYTMRHLSVAQAAIQLTNAVHAIENIRQNGFIRMNIGLQRVVALFRADTVERLVTSKTNLTKGEQYRYMEPWLGSGLLTSSGNHWKVHRKLLTPAFHFKVLESFAPIMNRNVRVMLQRIVASRDKELDIRHLMTDLALDIICETAMGTTVGAQSETDDKDAYKNPIQVVLNQLFKRYVNPFYQIDFIYNLSPDGRENAAVLAKINQYVKKVIKERMEEVQMKLQSGEVEDFDGDEAANKDKRPFLDSLLLTHLQNPLEFTEKDILDEVNSFMVAGHDTSAEGLIFTLLLVANDTRVQAAIAEELEQIFADEPEDCEVTPEHCKQMKYLEMTIKESLRLFPPVPAVARKVEHDFAINGHTIPAGCTAVIFFNLLHRDPTVFPSPERFIPERFEMSSPVYKVPYAHMPFSAGMRNCIGSKFAMQEMKIVLSSIIRRYKLVAVTQRDQVELHFGPVLEAKSPVVIRFLAKDETGKLCS